MDMKRLRHSKIRNTGLLFEFILRQLTADVLDKKTKTNAVKILKARFNETTELGKELALYNILTTKKFKSDKKANYFVNEVIKQRNNLNNSILRREKYNLIKELKSQYDLQKFLSSKINNYKVYASIYQLFENTEKLSPSLKTESFFNLVEHITTDNNNINLGETIGGTSLPQDDDLRVLTYRTLLEKFNEKYSKLNSQQKSLLRAYINNVSGTNSLKEYIDSIKPELKKELKKHSSVIKDKIVKIKLSEIIKSIDKFCDTGKSNIVNDKTVIQTMRYMEVLKELKKNG